MGAKYPIQFESVHLQRGSEAILGDIHLTDRHLLFKAPELDLELVFSLSTVQAIEKKPVTSHGHVPLHVACRSFQFARFLFNEPSQATLLHDTLQRLACHDSHEQLHAFRTEHDPSIKAQGGWSIYDPVAEFNRQGVPSTWRMTQANADYELCATYPRCVIVPAKINDATIRHGARFRSKSRFPALAYYYKHNGAVITRSAQPMVGFKGNRSIQDEKIIEAQIAANPNSGTNYIIDARPTANAYVNTAKGAGTENVENYKHCKKLFISIDNIHVMRESLAKVVEAIQLADTACVPLESAQIQRSGWLSHIRVLMKGTQTVVNIVHNEGANILVHCSDGWDRTSQLVSLAELCLDPYFRTLHGFMVLIEKSWVSFGHKFADRCGHFLSAKPREVSPVFHQFLDCVYQLWVQHPTLFEFNEALLLDIHYHVYACKFGTFLANSERERWQLELPSKTLSYWDDVKSRENVFMNEIYDKSNAALGDPLSIDPRSIRFWNGLFRRKEEGMVGADDPPPVTEETFDPDRNRQGPATTLWPGGQLAKSTAVSDFSQSQIELSLSRAGSPETSAGGSLLVTTPSPLLPQSHASSGEEHGFGKLVANRIKDALPVAQGMAGSVAGNVSNFFNRLATQGLNPNVGPRDVPLGDGHQREGQGKSDGGQDRGQAFVDAPEPAVQYPSSIPGTISSTAKAGPPDQPSADEAGPVSRAPQPGQHYTPVTSIRPGARPLQDRSPDFLLSLNQSRLSGGEEPHLLPTELVDNPWSDRR